MSNAMYSKDHEGNWWKTVWAEQCPEKVFIHGQCQGVKGHKGVHWMYGPSGSYEWDDNDDDPKHKHENIACGSTPPEHKDYVDPRTMAPHYYREHNTTTKVEDPEKIEALNRGEFEDGASINQPLDMDALDPEDREELQRRIDETRPGARLYLLDEGNPETVIPVLSNEPRTIRSDVGNEDHGGMPYEDFERVCDEATIKLVKSKEELPLDLWGCYPYMGGSIDPQPDHLTCADLCDRMDEHGVIDETDF